MNVHTLPRICLTEDHGPVVNDARAVLLLSDIEAARELSKFGVHCPGRVRSYWYEDVFRARRRIALGLDCPM